MSEFIGPLAYVGPETMLPLTSALAAVVGVVLVFWRYLVVGVKKVVGMLFRRSQ